MTLGLILIIFGILVAVAPQILVAMVSGFLIVTGLVLCAAGWRWRRAGRGTTTSWFLRW